MKGFIFIKTGANFGRLIRADVARLSDIVIETYSRGYNYALYVLDAHAVKVIFADQMAKLKAWQDSDFKDCCPVFLPQNFKDLLVVTDHWWAKYYEQAPDDSSSK